MPTQNKLMSPEEFLRQSVELSKIDPKLGRNLLSTEEIVTGQQRKAPAVADIPKVKQVLNPLDPKSYQNIPGMSAAEAANAGSVSRAAIIQAMRDSSLDYSEIGEGNKFGNEQLAQILFGVGQGFLGGTGHPLEQVANLGQGYTSERIRTKAFEDALSGKPFSEINFKGLAAQDIQSIVEARQKVSDKPLEDTKALIGFEKDLLELAERGVNVDYIRDQISSRAGAPTQERIKEEQTQRNRVDLAELQHELSIELEGIRTSNEIGRLAFIMDAETQASIKGQPAEMLNTVFDAAIKTVTSQAGNATSPGDVQELFMQSAATYAAFFGVPPEHLPILEKMYNELLERTGKGGASSTPTPVNDASKDESFNRLRKELYDPLGGRTPQQ